MNRGVYPLTSAIQTSFHMDLLVVVSFAMTAIMDPISPDRPSSEVRSARRRARSTVEQLWRRARLDEPEPPEPPEPPPVPEDMIHAAWRVTRLLGQISGMADDDRLSELPIRRWYAPSSVRDVSVLGTRQLVDLLGLAVRHDPAGGLPLHPDNPDNPDNADRTARWQAAAQSALSFLTEAPIHRDTPLAAMWPAPGQIAAHERKLAAHALDLLRKFGTVHCYEELSCPPYMLRQDETVKLVSLAQRRALDITRIGQEEARGIAVLRAEDLLNRAVESANLRSEVQAQKLIALLQGLGKTEPENPLTTFINVVRSADTKAMNLERDDDPIPVRGETQRALPAGD